MNNKGKAEYVGHQDKGNKGALPLFNVVWPGHRFDGSTVSANTLNKLKISEITDKTGKKLLFVPLPIIHQ